MPFNVRMFLFLKIPGDMWIRACCLLCDIDFPKVTIYRSNATADEPPIYTDWKDK